MRCSYHESVSKITRCWFAGPCKALVILGAERARLTVARRPEVLAVCVTAVCGCVSQEAVGRLHVSLSGRNLTALSWGSTADVLGFLAQPLQPKVVFLHIIPLE